MAEQVNQDTGLDWTDGMELDFVSKLVDWVEERESDASEKAGDVLRERATAVQFMGPMQGRSQLGHSGLSSANESNHAQPYSTNQQVESNHANALTCLGESLSEHSHGHPSPCSFCSSTDVYLPSDLYSSSALDRFANNHVEFGSSSVAYYRDVDGGQHLRNTTLDTYRYGSTHIVPAGGSFSKHNNGVTTSSDTSVLHIPFSAVEETAAAIESSANDYVSTTPALVCPHEGCPHEGTFRRNFELYRHIRSKHKGEKPFWCTCLGFFKGQTAPTFARPDKLADHIRTTHHRIRAAKFGCPDCSVAPAELDLLGLHIKKSHNWASPHPRALASAASSKQSMCPLWHCMKGVPLKDLIPHLLKHERNDLESNEQDLQARGYSYSGDHTLIDVSATSPSELGETYRGESKSVWVLCPVCKFRCKDHDAFEDHLNEIHLIDPRHRDHFQQWRNYARSFDVWPKAPRAKLRPWLPWMPRRHWKRDGYSVQCPATDCEFKGNIPTYLSITGQHVLGFNAGSMIGHQVSLLAPAKEIRPYSREILKLYPDFITHPVWNYIE